MLTPSPCEVYNTVTELLVYMKFFKHEVCSTYKLFLESNMYYFYFVISANQVNSNQNNPLFIFRSCNQNSLTNFRAGLGHAPPFYFQPSTALSDQQGTTYLRLGLLDLIAKNFWPKIQTQYQIRYFTEIVAENISNKNHTSLLAHQERHSD